MGAAGHGNVNRVSEMAKEPIRPFAPEAPKIIAPKVEAPKPEAAKAELPKPLDDGFPSAEAIAACVQANKPPEPILARFRCEHPAITFDERFDIVEAIHPAEALKIWQAKRGINGFTPESPAPKAQQV